MAKGGNQPTPNLKLLTKPEGTKAKDRSRAHRGGGGVVPDMNPLNGEVPEPPSDIKGGSEGRRFWRHYWKTAGQWLVAADYPLVVRLCRLHNIASAMQVAMDREEYTVQPKPEVEISVGHPMLGDYDRIIGRIERLEDRLGLNPVERSRIRVTPKEKESALDRWSSDRTKTGSSK